MKYRIHIIVNWILARVAFLCAVFDQRRTKSQRRAAALHYPQLFYYMPHRYHWKRPKQVCCVCGVVIKGTPAKGMNSPQMPAPQYWCEACVDKPPLNLLASDFVRQYEWERVIQNIGAAKGTSGSMDQLKDAGNDQQRKKALIGYWLRPTIQWICGQVSGHELSKTEWGYGGGKFVDRNCRWCDKQIKVPKNEEAVPHPALTELADQLGFNDEDEKWKG